MSEKIDAGSEAGSTNINGTQRAIPGVEGSGVFSRSF